MPLCAAAPGEGTKPLGRWAGEELLIEHGSSWMRWDDFCVRAIVDVVEDALAMIGWGRGGEALAEAMATSGPANELMVLALAGDRFALSQLDSEWWQKRLACVRPTVPEWTR
jgi:hypothetical protein